MMICKGYYRKSKHGANSRNQNVKMKEGVPWREVGACARVEYFAKQTFILQVMLIKLIRLKYLPVLVNIYLLYKFRKYI